MRAPPSARLLDAPCTASGTVRRHPDVKIHRRPEDIHARAALAFKLLENLWEHLRPGGRLLYTSCSVFRGETDEVVRTFLDNHTKEGMLLDPTVPWGRHEPTGIHNLTGEEGMDGFFYAVLLKTESTPTRASPNRLATRTPLTDTPEIDGHRTRPTL